MCGSIGVSVIVLVALVVMAVPVFAITGNWYEDNEHPFVGLVVFYDANGEFIWRCSGSLISPTKFLTAGHCTDTAEGAVTAPVYFRQDAGANYDPTLGYDPVTGYPYYCAAVRRAPCAPRLTNSTTTATTTSPVSLTPMM